MGRVGGVDIGCQWGGYQTGWDGVGWVSDSVCMGAGARGEVW